MIIEYQQDYLKELYEEGKAKKKKYDFQKKIIEKYKSTIDKLKAANSIEELYPLKSLGYERLKGDKKHLESVKVDMKYRIEFISKVEGEEPDIITICSIVELSNHYT